MSFGNGTRFLMRHGDPAEMIDIGQSAVELGAFSLSRETKADNKYSDGTGWKKVAGGMRDAGETAIKLEMMRSEKHHLKLLTDYNSDDLGRYGFQWPDADKTEAQCDGLVTGYEITHETEEKLYVSITVKWSGAPDWGNWT